MSRTEREVRRCLYMTLANLQMHVLLPRIYRVSQKKRYFISRVTLRDAGIGPHGNARKKRTPTEKKNPAPDGAGNKDVVVLCEKESLGIGTTLR